jgi:hypothetical protein
MIRKACSKPGAVQRKTSEVCVRASFCVRMSSPLPAVASALFFACSAIAAEDVVPAVQPKHVVAAKLWSLLPKYNPPKSGSTGDRRETDRPRNTIVRLPKDMLPPESTPAPAVPSENQEPAPEGLVRLPRYEVRERRLPNFKEREIFSPTARVDLYLKRHPAYWQPLWPESRNHSRDD